MTRSQPQPPEHNPAREGGSRARAASRREDSLAADGPSQDDEADEAANGLPRSGSRAVAAAPRFRIFIIDSGWNSVAGKVLRDNLALFNDLTPDHPTYLVDRATSVNLLRRHQEFVGCDPIISVHDLKAFQRRRRGDVYGVRAHLGLLRDEKAVINLMQLLAGFLSRYRDSEHFEAGVRNELRLEGLQGAIEIVMGAVEHKELIA